MDLTDDKGIIKFNKKQKMLVWLTMLIDRILRLLGNMKITISKKQIVNKKWIKIKRDNAKYNKDYYDYLEKNIHKYGFNNEKEFEENRYYRCYRRCRYYRVHHRYYRRCYRRCYRTHHYWQVQQV